MIIGARLVEEDEQLWLDTGMSTISGKNRFRVVAKGGRFLAIKVPGHSYWGGLAMPRGYAPASFYIFEWCGEGRDAFPDSPLPLWSERLVIPLRC
jgi:hypothetical protein